MYEMSTEVYGKWMYDLLDYKNGAELILNETVENEFLSGRGRSFGLEFMVEKKKGDFTGWVSYTLSRTQQKVEGYQVGDYTEAKNGINNGDWYSSNWDRYLQKMECCCQLYFPNRQTHYLPDGQILL
jgi:hypothetical protein